MAYSLSRAVTIDHTKCGSANSTNFPALFSGTYTYLKTTGNGGDVQNSNGYDIAFYSDAGLTTPLSWEVEAYNAATGAVIAWVKIPTLSASVDTVIYLAYGDSGISTFQGGGTGAAWDSNYAEVHHFGDGSTLALTDSTTNANTATNHSAAAITGKIGGAVDCGGGSYLGSVYRGSWVESPISDLTFGGTVTAGSIELWFNPQFAYNDGKGYAIFGAVNPAGTAEVAGWMHYLDGNWYLGWSDGSGDHRVILAASAINEPQNTWSHLSLVWSNGTAAKAYMNGALVGTAGSNSTVANLSQNLGIGGQNFTAVNSYLGYIDEFRLSKSARSADWILSSYNNQNSPSTFYSIGSPGGGGDVTLALTGNAGTAAVGTLGRGSLFTKALTGNAATAACGTVLPSLTFGLTGVTGTGAVGTVSINGNVTVSLTGNQATGSLGTLSPAFSAAITGNAGTSAVGTFSRASLVTLGLSGNAGTAAVGTITITGNRTVALTGVSALGSVGTISISGGNVWTPVTPASGTWTPAVSASTIWTPQ